MNTSLSSNCKTTSYSVSDTNSYNLGKTGFVLCSLNIRHILPKIDEFKYLLSQNESLQIVGVSETFLDGSISNNLINIDGFEVVRRDRQIRKGVSRKIRL